MRVGELMQAAVELPPDCDLARAARALLSGQAQAGVAPGAGPDLPPRLLTRETLLAALAAGRGGADPVEPLLQAATGVLGPEDACPEAEPGAGTWVVESQGRPLGVLTLPPSCLSLAVERPQAILDALDNPVVVIDAQGLVTYGNQAFLRLARLQRAEVLGRPLKTILADSQLSRIIATGQAEKLAWIWVDGVPYVSNRGPLTAGGRTVGAVALLQDVSELEAVTQELDRARQVSGELDAIIESSFDGIFVTDGQGRTTKVNQAYERITGISREEVLGRSMRELVDAGFYDESVSLKVMQTGVPETIVQTIKRTGKTIMVTGNPVRDETGQIHTIVTNVRDITELKRLELELERAEELRSQYELELSRTRASGHIGPKLLVKSQHMREVLELALRLARVDSTVLIQGESGVGKELFAELIHSHSRRGAKPLVKISCAAIPETLLESELFGYAPGAFTGALKSGKAGLFEVAEGGTIFLDEIGEMPLSLQAKMLRVLQDREIVRLGGGAPHRVDVRIVAATNRDLAAMVQVRSFRGDLFYRLNVVPLTIPPLRERREAIPHLARHYLERFNQQHGLDKRLGPRVMECFARHDWPGNVRELENLIERLVVTTPGPDIGPEHLPQDLACPGGFRPGPAPAAPRGLRETVEAAERAALEAAIARLGSSRQVALALGVNQSTVVRKARKYGLSLDA
jgi:PAS domain S-box-containing protein